jgi:hypothetical protein
LYLSYLQKSSSGSMSMAPAPDGGHGGSPPAIAIIAPGQSHGKIVPDGSFVLAATDGCTHASQLHYNATCN